MHCYICDKMLGPDEIKFNRDHDKFDPCSECLLIVSEIFGPDDDEAEIDRQLAYELFYEEILEGSLKELADEAPRQDPG